MKKTLILGLILALIFALPVAAKGGKNAFPYNVTVEQDLALVSTDSYGWLKIQTPCVIGWVNLAPGDSAVPFSRNTGCEGTYSFTITDTRGKALAAPFVFVLN